MTHSLDIAELERLEKASTRDVDGRWFLGAMNDATFIIDKPPSPAMNDVGPWLNPVGPEPIAGPIDDQVGRLLCDAHNKSVAALLQAAKERDRLRALLDKAVEAMKPFAEANVEIPSYVETDEWLKILSSMRAEARILGGSFRRAAAVLAEIEAAR